MKLNLLTELILVLSGFWPMYIVPSLVTSDVFSTACEVTTVVSILGSTFSDLDSALLLLLLLVVELLLLLLTFALLLDLLASLLVEAIAPLLIKNKHKTVSGM